MKLIIFDKIITFINQNKKRLLIWFYVYFSWLQNSSKVKISNITFKNIRGTSATQEGIVLICSSGIPCESVELTDIDLSFNGAIATAKCANVKPTIQGKAPSCAT